MEYPCENCKYEGNCVVEATVCRQRVFDYAEDLQPVECSAKVVVYYHGIEGVFA